MNSIKDAQLYVKRISKELDDEDFFDTITFWRTIGRLECRLRDAMPFMPFEDRVPGQPNTRLRLSWSGRDIQRQQGTSIGLPCITDEELKASLRNFLELSLIALSAAAIDYGSI